MEYLRKKRSDKPMRVFVLSLFLTIFVIPVPVLHSKKEFQKHTQKNKQDYNILMISITNLGAQQLGFYGYERETTPNIDKFAKRAIVFENFYSPASWTLPTGMSLFTSRHPYEHGVMNRYTDNSSEGGKAFKYNILESSIPTLVDILRANNYLTAAFTGGFDYRPVFGLTNRFEYYSDGVSEGMLKNFVDTTYRETRRFGSIVDVMPIALDWIQVNKEKKFFVFLQGYDLHCPFSPKLSHDEMFVDFDTEGVRIKRNYCYRGFHNDGKYVAYANHPTGQTLSRPFEEEALSQKDIDYLKAQYDAEIRYVDDNVGRFLKRFDKLKISKKTIIIILSEHGEMFAKHGRFGRAGTIRGTLYDDVIHIPLLMKIPGKKHKIVNQLAQLMDLFPTILNMLDIPVPSVLEGKSLLPMIENDESIHEEIYGGSIYGKKNFRYYGFRSVNEFVRNMDYKLIHEIVIHSDGKVEEKYELYNIKNDKEELKNIYNEKKEVAKTLKKKLSNWSIYKNYEMKPSKFSGGVSRKGFIPEDVISASRSGVYTEAIKD